MAPGSFNAAALLFTSASSAFALPDTQMQQVLRPNPCNLLAATFPYQVVSSSDVQRHAAYWSAQQAELLPACRFFPQHTRDVQEALSDVLWPNNVSIAICSGEQSSRTWASNIHHGITIDLARLNRVSLEDNNQLAVLGAGARWKEVYFKLAMQNLTVAGDRFGNTGVGGHILGGGISWFANQFGWTCESVIEFEVVTPQGQAIWANAHVNEDIFFALKGSAGALGIVTKIKLPTFPIRKVYGGAIGYAPEQVPEIFQARRHLAFSAGSDPSQAGYISYRWIEGQKSFAYDAHLMNIRGDKSNAALNVFTDIPHKTSTLRSTSISDMVKESDKSRKTGLRRTQFTLTPKCNVRALEIIYKQIQDFAPKVKFY